MTSRNNYPLAMLMAVFFACSPTKETAINDELIKDARQFINNYTATYVDLYSESAEAEWQANIRIVEGDTINAYRVRQTNEKLAEYTGSEEVISQAQKYLDQKDQLEPLQVKQLKISCTLPPVIRQQSVMW